MFKNHHTWPWLSYEETQILFAKVHAPKYHHLELDSKRTEANLCSSASSATSTEVCLSRYMAWMPECWFYVIFHEE